MTSGLLQLPLILGGLFALGCLIVAFRSLRRKRLVDDTPTSRTQGVFIGLVELKGTAESESPLTSYLAGVRCILYSWQVREHWSRTVTETYRDAQGRTQTRTRTESGWTEVAKGGESAPFYLRDDTGVIRIVPEGASIHGVKTLDETCSRENPLYYGKGPAHEVANSTHRRQFVETAIPVGASLYVMGQARERQDVVAAEIARDKEAPLFVISTQSEKQVSAGYGRWSVFWVALGLVLVLGGVMVRGLLEQAVFPVQWQAYAVAAAGFAGALALGWVWTVYNSIINLRYRVDQAWSQVDVQLKRRNSLIPNLAAAVEGYRAHESETQELVATLRGQLAATPPGIAGPDFKGLAPAIRIVVERYPELRASESFLSLQQALVDAEQRIALARDYFNGIAAFYNIRLGIIPDRFVAALARLRPRAFMSASDFERAEVQVRLVS